MGSKGRIPPHYARGPLHPEPIGAGRPPFRHADMLPPPEVLEQKVASQHLEMETLATENQRLAATHASSRQQLAAAQQEIQLLETQIRASKADREQKMRDLVDRISSMEAELQASDRLKMDLHQAKTEAQILVEVRQDLVSKVQQLNSDLQRAHTDLLQIPTLMSELNHLRQEFLQYRATYERERKIYRDHIESLQAMEKEYNSMTDEVAKLRTELNNKKSAYGSPAGHGDADAYGVQQVHHQFPASSTAATAPTPAAPGVGVVTSSGGTPTYAAPQSGPASAKVGYDVKWNIGYEAQRSLTYDLQSGQVYNARRVSGYDAYRGVHYDTQRPHDPQRAAYEKPWVNNYDSHSRVAAAPPPPPHGQTPVNNIPYRSAVTPPAARISAGNKMRPQDGNTTRSGSMQKI